MKKLLLFILALFTINAYSFTLGKDTARKDSTVAHHNIGLLVGGNILEGNGIRLEFPTYFYSSKTHGFSVSGTVKYTEDDNRTFGINAGYYYFIEPSYRDITFFLNYNTSYFFEEKKMFTHIFGVGTQIDIGENCFIQHSIGLGFQQSASNFNYMNAAGQLRLAIGFYLREMPVVHIKDDWEH